MTSPSTGENLPQISTSFMRLLVVCECVSVRVRECVSKCYFACLFIGLSVHVCVHLCIFYYSV